MNSHEKNCVLQIIFSLWSHDTWTWGNTCSSLINHEIDFNAPASVKKEGENIEAIVTMKDGRKFELNRIDGGWSMGYINA